MRCPAVFPTALRAADESAVANAIEHHHFWPLRLGQLDTCAAQGVFDIYVVTLNKASGLGIDVGLWPRNVGVAVITSTVLGDHLGLGQISDISRTTEAPERHTYETVAHSDDRLTPKRPGFAGAFVCVAYTKG